MWDKNGRFVGAYDSPLGGIMLCSDGANLVGLYFACEILGESKLDSRESSINSHKDLIDSAKKSYFGEIKCVNLIDLPIFTQTKKWLDSYFCGENLQFAPPIAFPKVSSRFALRVWEILQSIPYGETMTYGAIAKQVAREFGIAKMSAQAVGGAVSHNPISIIVPCHRVIGANGNLTGYAGGVDKKIALLRLEGIAIDSLKMPKGKA